MHDLYHNTELKIAFTYAQRTATTNGSIIDTIDTQGGNASQVLFGIFVHAVAAADATNYVTFTVEEGDASDGSDFTSVNSANIRRIIDTGDGTDSNGTKINATGQAASILAFGYKPEKRYFRLVATETGTTDATYSAQAILGGFRRTPKS